MNPRLLLAAYVIVTMLPLLLVAVSGWPPRAFWDELATAAGLVAFAAILVEFALSGRFRSVSRGMGMDVTMRLHQLFARTALAFVLVHPFLYRSPGRMGLPWDETRQLTITFDLSSLASGVLAFVLLPVLVLTAIGRDKLPYTYETWRLIHGVMALLIAALTLHHALSAGRYSGHGALLVFWMALSLGAAVSLAYVYVLKPLSQRRRPWSVAHVRPVALKTWELVLRPEGHRGLDFEAGQFVWINVGHSPFRLDENPFSISSAPGQRGELQFVIKELGDFTRSLGGIAPGTRAYVDGPHGNLVVSSKSAPGVALIAGGVGIAPLLSILRQMIIEDDSRPVTLVYGNRLASQMVYREELQDLAARGRLDFVPVLSEPHADWDGRTGWIDAATIREVFSRPGATSWLYVLCGPPQMMTEVEAALIDMGVPSDRILLERFSYD